MNPSIRSLAEGVICGVNLGRSSALDLAGSAASDTPDLLYWANRIRQHFMGDEVVLCSIVNARSGGCSEDCKFCAQSAHHATAAPRYGLLPPAEIIEAAETAVRNRSMRFGIVTSGRCAGPQDDLGAICSVMGDLRSRYPGLEVCASLGSVTREAAEQLRRAGISHFNHNLETGERFFPSICTTHTWQDRARTVSVLKEAGIRVCSGGLFGMGEEWNDRVDLALALRDLDVDAVPINFLNPIPGTPLAGFRVLTPMECLKIIALYRFLLPTKEIKVCGGREVNLRDLQSWMFYAGANATMAGHYLTTAGRPPEHDLQMIEDLCLSVKGTSV